jgi:hypothetical protein
VGLRHAFGFPTLEGRDRVKPASFPPSPYSLQITPLPSNLPTEPRTKVDVTDADEGNLSKYPKFSERAQLLHECTSSCRRQAQWAGAAVFLQIALKSVRKEEGELKASGFMLDLAEVYFAEGNLELAEKYGRTAFGLRKRALGNEQDLLCQECVYVLAKICDTIGKHPFAIAFKSMIPLEIYKGSVNFKKSTNDRRIG